MPKIYDNIENHLIDGLHQNLKLSHRADFCVGYFNLRGWGRIAEEIDKLKGAEVIEGSTNVHRICRLLVGMQKLPIEILKTHFSNTETKGVDNAEVIKIKRKLAQEFTEQLTIGVPTEADEKTLRKLSQQLKEGKITVKLHLRYPLHAKLYLAHSTDPRVPIVGFLGSSNLTMAGLDKQGELNIDVLEQDAAHKLSQWFDQRWQDRWCVDITKEIIEVIDTSWAGERLLSPYHIYLKMVYHLSQEARAGLTEYQLPKIFQQELFEFQQASVKIAAKKLDKRDGVLIGDVVGLGKTITACAIAKMFEERNFYATLIICPPNLKTMWKEYVNKYDMKAHIVSSGEVQKQLADLRRFRLVIIDESHNLRNDQGSRYRAIKSYLESNESKVILLSATPYNKTYLDLSNQLRLFIADDKDLGISPERYIEKIGGQAQFNAQHSETFIRSIKAFEKSTISDDWRELMRLYMVRRTRSFIRNNYAETDPTNGRKFLTFSDGSRSYFPDRVPKKVEYHFDPTDATDQYAKLYSDSVITLINRLRLSRYGLANFIIVEKKTDKQKKKTSKANSVADRWERRFGEEKRKPIPLKIKPTPQEAKIMEDLSRAGTRLMGFCRTNLFKRLESSGYSFLLSLSRHILRNYVFVYAIQNGLEIPISRKNTSQSVDDFLEDSDVEDEEENLLNLILDEKIYLAQGEKIYKFYQSENQFHKFNWIRSEFFLPELKNNLINDGEKIIRILKKGKNWKPSQDRQLNALHDLITVKHPTEKVLVFTQFADTAYYLAKELKERGIEKIDLATGNSEEPTLLAQRFSPMSNNKPEINEQNKDLRVLIATDVLSEGQNLQDAHVILNYDLPWAIIRLIQRAGRVDRIGQKAEKILCYSFLPEDGIEQIINLRGRLTHRISENAQVVGSDETFFDGDPINIADLYNEKAGILDGEEDEIEVDLGSYCYQIWKNATDANPVLKKTIPDMSNVVYATKQNQQAAFTDGVIVYTRTANDNDVLTWVDKQGKLVTQSQLTILQAAQCSAEEPPKEKQSNHHELVRTAIDFIHHEEKNTGGALGKKTGIKYRVYTRLDEYCKLNENTLFVNEALKKAVNDIYNYPMKEFAKDILNRQLKTSITNEELAALVVSLREEDKLCIINDDDEQNREAQIICSLGLTKN